MGSDRAEPGPQPPMVPMRVPGSGRKGKTKLALFRNGNPRQARHPAITPIYLEMKNARTQEQNIHVTVRYGLHGPLVGPTNLVFLLVL